MKGGPATLPFQRQKNNLQIVMYMVIASAVIFYLDAVTPMGLAVWVFYFIPLFMTIALSWRYAPFIASVAFIVLIFIGFLISPEEMPAAYELLNRTFFSVVLIVAAFFIQWSIRIASRGLPRQ
ncbi:MAG TPA: hypothetical protein VLV30_09490 [Methanomicrobiales archaeon]|nr:hypothetical protein [Methanomicrobiales archaeon]